MLLEVLTDNRWHRKESLKQRLMLNEFQFSELIAFLSEYDFVKFDSTSDNVKIKSTLQKLLSQTVIQHLTITNLVVQSTSCLKTFFEDDRSLSEFWKMDIKTRKSIWGETFDVERTSQSFNEELISPTDLDVH